MNLSSRCRQDLWHLCVLHCHRCLHKARRRGGYGSRLHGDVEDGVFGIIMLHRRKRCRSSRMLVELGNRPRDRRHHEVHG